MEHLHRYLNDHLAGSTGAVDLLETIARSADDLSQREFFLDLKDKIERDRLILHRLLEKLGSEDSTLLELAGKVTAKASKLKLRWEGLETGELGRLEALEMLCLGIQGKCLLWRMLAEISAQFPEWSDYNFSDLELEAIQQRDAVEHYRIQAGRNVLLTFSVCPITGKRH